MRFGLAILAASLACGIAPASAYTTIFAFGDSLSDAGNISILDGVVSRRRASVMLYERWRWTLRSRFVGGGFKPP